MASPAPPKGAAQRTVAGPFLRYGNIYPETRTWKGSCLLVTKGGSSKVEAGANGDSGAPGLSQNGGGAPAAAPRLTLEDDGGRGEAEPVLLSVEQGWAFWRFDLELQLGHGQRAVQYELTLPEGSAGPSATLGPFKFWLPGADQPLHW